MSDTQPVSNVNLFDVFLNLSRSTVTADGLDDYMNVSRRRLRLAPGQRLTALTRDRSQVLVDEPTHQVPTGQSALGHALALAKGEQRGLFLIAGEWLPQGDVLEAIAALGAIDPNVGTIQPRFAVNSLDVVAGLPDYGGTQVTLVPRSALPMLPEYTLTPNCRRHAYSSPRTLCLHPIRRLPTSQRPLPYC